MRAYSGHVCCESLETRQLLAATFAERSIMDTAGTALASERIGNLVFIADQERGIAVYDVTRPGAPVAVTTFQTTSAALDLMAQGNLLYVGLARGLEVLDVSNVANIRSVGAFATSENVQAVEVRDGLAYLGTATSLSIVNVGNPVAPVLVSRLTNIGANEIELTGDVLYAADSTRGLRAVDVSNTRIPRLVSTSLSGFDVVDVARQDGFLLAATRNNGIFTLSIATNPSSPQLLDQTPVLNGQIIRSAELAGPNLFVATSTGLVLINAENPAAPFTIGQFAINSSPISDVRVAGGSVLLSAGAQGVRLVEVSDTVSTITAGVLQVVGTSAGDDISIVRGTTQVTVQRNGLIQRVAFDGLQGVRVNGLAGADRIVISNLALNATVGGGSGQDTIVTSEGADSVHGGKGGDTINTSGNADTVFGDEGLDQILGGSGDDFLSGDSGNDTIQGGLGNDILQGGSENDSLIGGDGSDNLFGQEGNDILIGKGGTDFFVAGTGADHIFARDGVVDVIHANVAQDVIDADPIDQINPPVL